MIGFPNYLLLDALLGLHGTSSYPPAYVITNFAANPATLEVGSNQAVLLSWTLPSDPDSQSINNGIGSLLVGQRSVMSNPISATTTFIITAVRNLTSYFSNVTVNFQRKRYWFVSADPNIGNAAFAYGDLPVGFQQEFATQRSKDTEIVFDCTGGKYFYYMFPAAFGIAPDEDLIHNGWKVKLDPANVRTASFTNQSGDTVNYIVLRSDNLLHGNEIGVKFV